MPKIRVEYEVPEGDCWECEWSESSIGINPPTMYCTWFDCVRLECSEDGLYRRCQACIDAEIKDVERSPGALWQYLIDVL